VNQHPTQQLIGVTLERAKTVHLKRFQATVVSVLTSQIDKSSQSSARQRFVLSNISPMQSFHSAPELWHATTYFKPDQARVGCKARLQQLPQASLFIQRG